MKKLFLLLFSLLFIVRHNFAQTETKSGISSTMQTNPTISVTIGGKFIVNGTFPAMFSERVDQFVTRIYNAAKENSLSIAKDLPTAEKINKNINEDYAIRGIILKSSNGDERIIDLAKFRVNGDFKNNPYLKNDDVLIFPAVDLERNFVRIMGAVNNPTIFMFVDGDKLSDAIELAQGVNKAYEEVNYAKIYRLNYNGSKVDSLIIPISSDVALQRGDRIVIQANETKRKDYKVNVIGEVKEPGYVPITFNSTTIADVIKAVGGFTEDADLKKVRIYKGENILPFLEREYNINFKNNSPMSNKEFEEKFLQYENLLMYRMSNLTEQDTAYFYIENQLRLIDDKSNIDFTKANESNSEISKIIVHDGDIIFIPKIERSVYVFGQVANPGRVAFIENRDYHYYIKKAGGFGNYSDNDVMLIKSLSRKWISINDESAIIEQGDYIYVPKNPKKSFNYYLTQSANYLSIIGSIATIVLLLTQLKK